MDINPLLRNINAIMKFPKIYRRGLNENLIFRESGAITRDISIAPRYTFGGLSLPTAIQEPADEIADNSSNNRQYHSLQDVCKWNTGPDRTGQT